MYSSVILCKDTETSSVLTVEREQCRVTKVHCIQSISNHIRKSMFVVVHTGLSLENVVPEKFSQEIRRIRESYITDH